MAIAKTIGSGWHGQTLRHSNARRLGRAGGNYAGNVVVRFPYGKSVHTSRGEIIVDETITLPFQDKEHAEKYISMLTPRAKASAMILQDSDGDGVPDQYDCEPHNPKKQDAKSLDLTKKQLSEAEVNLLMRRINNGKIDPNTLNVPDEGWELTPSQVEKGRAWLMNLYKTPTGKERSNNPYGYREQAILDNFQTITLKGTYSENGRYHYPLYEAHGNNTTMEYYMSGGQIHIIG